MKKIKFSKLIPKIILVSLVIPIIFIIVKLIINGYNSNLILTLTQCILGIFAFFIPSILEKKWELEIPPIIYISYLIFLYCSIVLGEVRSFYYNGPHWDTMLHLFSGTMLGIIGFSIIHILNKKTNLLNLSPMFVCLFSFCFAVTIGVLWEIYEFSFDGLLNLNMQKFSLNDGTSLIGRKALYDTMKDLLIDVSGASVAALIGYLSIIKDKNWLNNLMIKKTKD